MNKDFASNAFGSAAYHRGYLDGLEGNLPSFDMLVVAADANNNYNKPAGRDDYLRGFNKGFRECPKAIRKD